MAKVATVVTERDPSVRMTSRPKKRRVDRRQQALQRLRASTRRVMNSPLVQEMRVDQAAPPSLAEVRQRLSGLARPLSVEVMEERRGR